MKINEVEKYFLQRRKKKITLTELARKIGCSISLLSHYESGNCNMSDEKLILYKKYIDEG